MPAPIPNSARSAGRVSAAQAPEAPEPGLLEGLGAAFTAARDDQSGRLQDAQVEAYAPLINTLDDMGLNASRFILPVRSGAQVNYDGVWSLIDEARRRDPKSLTGLPATRAEFETRWRDDFRQRAEQTEQLAGRAGWATRLAGGFAGAMTDPVNIATLPVGGVGKSIVARVLTEGAANAGIEALQQPLINAERAGQGRAELSAEQMAFNVGSAALLGGAMRGGIEAAPRIGPAFVKAVTANRARLPQGLRERWDAHLLSKADPLDDPVLMADLSEAIVGPENLTELERAAGVAARRDGQVEAANPFRWNGAGADMHDALAAETFRAALEANPLARMSTSGAALARALPPTRAPAGSIAEVEGAEARFMSKVRGAESGGDDAVRNQRSSAQGRYQFTNGTWLAYYKRRFGAGGLSDAQIIAKKTSGNLQDALMRDLTADNAAALRRAGHAPSEGNLYLAHFAGPEGARKLLDADPRASVESILGGKAVEANPFLRGKDAGWAVQWAHGKMGSAPGGRSIELRDDFARADEAASMQAAVDNALDRAAQLGEADRAARAEGADAGDLLAESLSPIERADLPEVVAPVEPRASDADAPRAEVLAILPQLREIVDGKRSLNKVADMARDLGVSEDEMRAGLGEMIREGRITVNRKSGNYMRKPKAPEGPEDVLDFIARGGGIRDDEGHALGLRGISKKERRELHPAAIKNVRRRREGGGKRDWQRMTRRNGPLLRHEGRSIDAVGEQLWEAGYLRGMDGERPTTREVLEYLDQRINGGEPSYPIGQAPERAAPAWEDEWEDLQEREALDAFLEEWKAAGNDEQWLDDDLLARAAQIKREEPGLSAGAAAERAAVEQYSAALRDLLDETEDDLYDIPYDATAQTTLPSGDSSRPGSRGGRHAGERGNEGAGSEGGALGSRAAEPAPASGQQLADLSPDDRAPFIDAQGPAAKAQADSLIHDARVIEDSDGQADFAAPTRDQARTALERQGEGRLKGAAPQKAPGSDGGLFDAQAHDMGFRFDDEGEEASIRDLLDDIDAEEAELKNIRDCL